MRIGGMRIIMKTMFGWREWKLKIEKSKREI